MSPQSSQLNLAQTTAQYDALYEMEMAKARANYLNRKKMTTSYGDNLSWDQL